MLTKWPVFLQNAFGNRAYVNQTHLNGKIRKKTGESWPTKAPLRIATDRRYYRYRITRS